MVSVEPIQQFCQMGALMIREHRDAANLTLEDLAAEAEMSVSQLSRIERGERVARINELEKIAARLRTTVASLIGEEASHQVPIVSWVSAGSMRGTDGVTAAEIERYVPVADLPSGDWIALTVHGDSMNRIAPDQSIIILNRADDTLIDGKFYVFSIDGGEATFKMWRRGPHPMLQPYSTNLDHLSMDARRLNPYVLGRVRRVITNV